MCVIFFLALRIVWYWLSLAKEETTQSVKQVIIVNDSLIFPRFSGVVQCAGRLLKKERIMPKPQPTFTAELKQEAVHLAHRSGKSKAQIARELGISDSALSSWCREAAEHGVEGIGVTSPRLLSDLDGDQQDCKDSSLDHHAQQTLQGHLRRADGAE
jgi:transposase-like protein